MAYSADDFNAVAFGIDGSRPNARLLFAALRIASLVMREGVIEGALGAIDFNNESAGWIATAIRNRLTGETG